MKRNFAMIHFGWAILSVATFSAIVEAQKVPDISQRFTRSEVMIAMRDGVKLYTTLYVPRAQNGPLPFILYRTPYGINARGPSALASYLKDLADEGYIFAFQ